MTTVRRVTLQLTPLLDLMLIVIFAQYMEMRLVARQEADRITSERQEMDIENQSLKEQVDQWELQQRNVDRDKHREREQMGQILRQLFKVPEATVNKFVQPRGKSESSGFAPTEIADLKARFQQLANSNGDQVIDHLLTFNEMRKQFDVWEFYLDEDGALLITVGQDRQHLKSKIVDSPEAFVDVVLKIRNQFPPTKNSVLMLCSYGDCRLLNRLSMTRGLPAIAERLKKDGQGTQNFEYAVFGYRPQPEPRPSASPRNR
jgi:hypothetical protein